MAIYNSDFTNKTKKVNCLLVGIVILLYYFVGAIIVLLIIYRKVYSLFGKVNKQLEVVKKVISDINSVLHRFYRSDILSLLFYCLLFVFLPVALLPLIYLLRQAKLLFNYDEKLPQFSEKESDFLDLIFELNEVYKKTDDYLNNKS